MQEIEAEKLIEENEVLKKEIELYKQNEKMFQALVETAVGDIGEDFFNKIVIKLSEWLNAECVIIGQLIKENLVEGFPMYLDGKIIEGFTYTLKDTPCDLTSKKGYCVYADDVINSFPKSKDLVELNIKGYVGTALYNKLGEPNGILCAMSRKKLQLPPQAENILRIVGARITTEIERIKAQKALLISEENLRKANNSKDKLFSIIAHDLKNPFNALIGFSGLIKKNLKDNNFNNIDKYISVIHDISSQTYNMLINLLEWSMTQTNQINFNPLRFNLSDLVKDIVVTHIQIANQKTQELISTIPPGVIILADKAMVATIVRNLVSNAIKFTPSGGKICIDSIVDNENVTVSVSDTGVGIKDENIGKIFSNDDYYSTKGTDNEKGAGLGLMLCKEFVNKHNGKIWVENVPGSGACFKFLIPFN
jgi:signal transduction histidine kinase